MAVTSLLNARARPTALSTAMDAVAEPSTGMRMCLNMWLSNQLMARALEVAGAAGHDQRVAMATACRRLDRRRLVHHASIIQQEQGPRLGHGETLPVGSVGLEDARLAALDA